MNKFLAVLFALSLSGTVFAGAECTAKAKKACGTEKKTECSEKTKDCGEAKGETKTEEKTEVKSEAKS